jgi:stage III sporulation protein AA|tara:strand:+ start:800 stop:2476 length:1677 start_codon:yes stop_codon:yes gene_type:complete
MLLADDLNQLLEILPKFISKPLKKHPCREQLIEIVLDLGRRPEARFANTTEYLAYQTIVWQDLDYILKRLGKFSGDNRAGIEKTLHRISSMRNRQGSVIGLTCRIGRAIFGTVSIIRDLLEQKKSILLLGRPGVGKTTAIREIARVLSDGMQKRVIIIDTSNEIAGDGDLPHPSIGKARRMQVPNHLNQHEVMIEAVENHMPEIIIIDEIGTELEAEAARSIAERGVQLVGTAHGNTLENLIKNPTISDLIGGIQYVTLGDEEAKRRGTSKSILERKAPPTFEAAVEIHDAKIWAIHENVEQSVDFLLQGKNFPVQKRSVVKNKNAEMCVDCRIIYTKKEFETIKTGTLNSSQVEKKQKPKDCLTSLNKESASNLTKRKTNKNSPFEQDFIFLYPYGINNQDLKSLIRTLKLPIILTKEIYSADKILALANLVKNNRKLKQSSHSKNIPIHTIQSNNLLQIAKALRLVAKKGSFTFIKNKKASIRFNSIVQKEFLTPLEETRLAIEEIVISNNAVIDLFPRPNIIRKQQHELISNYHLVGLTVGKGQFKRLRIFPKSH